MLLESGIIAIITIIISAIVGYAIPYFNSIIKFIVGKSFRKEPIEGTWHTYHFTRMYGHIYLRYDKWIIKRNLLNTLTVKTDDPKNPDLKYEGFISVERNYFLVNISGVKHKEEAQFRFFDFIPTGQDIVYGLCLGVDFDNKPKAEVWIMSRRKLSDEEANKILRSITIIRDNLIIGIREGDISDEKLEGKTQN